MGGGERVATKHTVEKKMKKDLNLLYHLKGGREVEKDGRTEFFKKKGGRVL